MRIVLAILVAVVVYQLATLNWEVAETTTGASNRATITATFLQDGKGVSFSERER